MQTLVFPIPVSALSSIRLVVVIQAPRMGTAGGSSRLNHSLAASGMEDVDLLDARPLLLSLTHQLLRSRFQCRYGTPPFRMTRLYSDKISAGSVADNSGCLFTHENAMRAMRRRSLSKFQGRCGGLA